MSDRSPRQRPLPASDLGVVDSHCHLQSLAPDDCARALDEAREAGVAGFLVPAIRLADSDRLLDLCAREPDVWCALGVHPHEAATWAEGDELRLRALLDEPGVVAVGECGLDFHYDHSPRDVQAAVMRKQWELAMDAELPVIVHNRESNLAIGEILAEGSFDRLRGVFHSFAGGADLGSELVRRGFYLGLSGMITFPAADNVREVLPGTPRARLLVETDTPYLAPVPHRGRPNRPAFVVAVLERLAEELGISAREAAGLTSGNFFALFARAAREGA